MPDMGRGAEVRYQFNKLSIGGFYNRPRFFRDIKDEFNVYSALKIRKESEISIGYLYKMPRKEESDVRNNNLNSEAHLPYAKGKFKISKNINLSGEFAYSTTKRLKEQLIWHRQRLILRNLMGI